MLQNALGPMLFLDNSEGLHLGRQLFFPPGWLPIQAPPRKSCVRPSEKNKQAQKNKPARHKNKCPLSAECASLWPERKTNATKKNKLTWSASGLPKIFIFDRFYKVLWSTFMDASKHCFSKGFLMFCIVVKLHQVLVKFLMPFWCFLEPFCENDLESLHKRHIL